MLTISNLTLFYGDLQALDNVSLSLTSGEVMAVLGPSGSGKSSLLRAVAGLETPTSGRIWLHGEDVTDKAVHLRQVGLMFQDYALFPHLSVADNVAFGLRMQHRDRTATRQRVAEVLTWVDLDGFADRSIESLSGGEQQRVALARSLAPEPLLIMLDEPVGALDRALRARLVPELAGLIRRLGVTAVYVTHDQDEAFAIADRIAIIHRGRIRQVGSPTALWKAPSTEFVARFLGFENFADAKVADGGVATTPWGTLATRLVPGHHRVTLRLDGIRLDPEGTVRGRVTSAGWSPAGSVIRLACGEGILAVPAGWHPPSVGDEITLTIDPGAVIPLTPDS